MCPRCQSEAIHRSRARTRWESWRKTITGKRPYRCLVCGWRGWGVDLGPKFNASEIELATRALAPEPPNLTGTALASEEKASAVNLKELDSFYTIGEKPH
jgi:hypothetical protein